MVGIEPPKNLVGSTSGFFSLRKMRDTINPPRVINLLISSGELIVMLQKIRVLNKLAATSVCEKLPFFPNIHIMLIASIASTILPNHLL